MGSRTTSRMLRDSLGSPGSVPHLEEGGCGETAGGRARERGDRNSRHCHIFAMSATGSMEVFRNKFPRNESHVSRFA
jgi:hypothetical protein